MQGRHELIARYGGPAPRYTSYPTANLFGPIEPGDTREALRTAGPDFRVYVHTPFCQKLCWYCGCNTVIRRDLDVGESHVDHLLAELDLLRPDLPAGARIRRLDMGGGTPNFLRPDALERLVHGIEAVLEPSDDREYASEIDPRTVKNAHLQTFLDLGFRRFSLGVQTLEPVVQEAVNRQMPRDRPGEIVRFLRRGGATSINFDLMVGLPLQTTETLDRTLGTVLDIAPDRLAVFQYAHIPSMRPAQKLLERVGLPDMAARDALMQHAVERLTQAGYTRIGFDHFAQKSDPLAVAQREGRLGRDFQGFTTDDHMDLIALGPSAIGRLGDLYTQNQRDPGLWAEHVAAGRLPVLRGWHLSADDKRHAALIHALMCRHRVRWADVGFTAAELSDRLERLAPFLEDGLVALSEEGLDVLPAGRDFVRQIAAIFDFYLTNPNAHASVA
ncbi:MAG: oxygen-independent coproporphyrinogen III oxidase [Alphaproteobacteria bacterium]|nr:oxygen-independent coproporphyrinogen III oxidase [Alphaproteobacteria bacterium]